MTPEARARQTIDALLTAAGWHVCNVASANIHAATGVAIREFPLNPGHGFADYLLYVNGKACGVIEAKKEGATLSGVEVQSALYAQGLPAALPAWRRPLPFVFESTGVETRFTNGLDPQPRARPLFAFFRPELLVQWLTYLPVQAGSASAASEPDQAPTFLVRLQQRPTLVTEWGQGGASFKLWPVQITAIRNLEESLAANKPRALIQMATGSGKTFTSISFIYRLIKFGGVRRVLFLVDRGNLARQTKKEFDAYASPHNAYKFGEEYIVQHLQGNQLDKNARQESCGEIGAAQAGTCSQGGSKPSGQGLGSGEYLAHQDGQKPPDQVAILVAAFEVHRGAGGNCGRCRCFVAPAGGREGDPGGGRYGVVSLSALVGHLRPGLVERVSGSGGAFAVREQRMTGHSWADLWFYAICILHKNR
ncbi:DEAD/DEAH box helicase family protein [Hydrogenophaga sp. PAMC20947]|uniref:DEAD/DEAH box helicase family protein n=1 Tax=Hydrogenophaga sp. PAMC20947 TaxID=2565558 RepID=UPI001B34B721|nr:DEAD/DEAH box helicase family protein [Hydrogenophaga sp. PAMC20947]